MKSITWDEAILAEHRAYLREDSAKDAFDTLVATAIEMPAYETAPGWHGEIRDFRYDDTATGERPFASIVNRNDLLFYVRSAGLRKVRGGFDALKNQFGSASENSRGEWTVRIPSTEEAERLNAYLFASKRTRSEVETVATPTTEDSAKAKPVSNAAGNSPDFGLGSKVRTDLAVLWRRILQTDHERLLGLDFDRLQNRSWGDQLAQPGYVGPGYRPGGLAFEFIGGEGARGEDDGNGDSAHGHGKFLLWGRVGFSLNCRQVTMVRAATNGELVQTCSP